MKKLVSLLIITIMIMILPLSGCNSKVLKEETSIMGNQEVAVAEALTIEDYFPFRENVILDYQGIGNEYAEQMTFIEFVDGNRAQMKIMNPGTVFVKVLEYNNGALTEVFGETEFYHIENMLKANSNTENIVLKEPIEIGNQWLNSQGYKVEITDIDKEISTPFGAYSALEVTTFYEEGRSLKEYYAKDIGLVSKVYKDGLMQVETLLQDIKNEKQAARIMSFYPINNGLGSAYIYQDIEVATNDDIKDILEGIMKNPPKDELLASISPNTRINSINLNRSSWTLEVDFSGHLLEEMNVGSSLENEIIMSIVNTLGKYYDVDQVYITIDEVAYESGHLGIEVGQSFTVNIADIEEYK